MKVHPGAMSLPPLTVLIVLSAMSTSLFGAEIPVGVLAGGGSVVYDMDTKSTGEVKVVPNIASPARSFMVESMLASVFIANEKWIM